MASLVHAAQVGFCACAMPPEGARQPTSCRVAAQVAKAPAAPTMDCALAVRGAGGSAAASRAAGVPLADSGILYAGGRGALQAQAEKVKRRQQRRKLPC